MNIKFTVNCVDSDAPYSWMRLCTSFTPSGQDSGEASFMVEVEEDEVYDFEMALENDPQVLSYQETE